MRCLYIAARARSRPITVGKLWPSTTNNWPSLHDLGHEVHLWHFAKRAPELRCLCSRRRGGLGGGTGAMCASITITTLPQRPNLGRRFCKTGWRTALRQDAIFPCCARWPTPSSNGCCADPAGLHLRPTFVAGAGGRVAERGARHLLHHDWFSHQGASSRRAESEAMRQMEERRPAGGSRYQQLGGGVPAAA